MLPAFGQQHRLSKKWSESMYLLDKKIYLKFHQIEKIASGPKSEILICSDVSKNPPDRASQSDSPNPPDRASI